GVVRGLSPDLVLGKQGADNFGRGPAAGLVEVHHRLDVGRGSRHHTLSRDRLGERPLEHAAVDCRGSQDVTADQRYRGRIAHRPTSPFVGGGGLVPEVELGTVGLHLAPHGESAKSSQYDQQHLNLHSEEPSASMTFTARSQTYDQEIPAAYQAQSPPTLQPAPPADNPAPEKIVVDSGFGVDSRYWNAPDPPPSPDPPRQWCPRDRRGRWEADDQAGQGRGREARGGPGRGRRAGAARRDAGGRARRDAG